jgi:hypothetical protein
MWQMSQEVPWLAPKKENTNKQNIKVISTCLPTGKEAQPVLQTINN